MGMFHNAEKVSENVQPTTHHLLTLTPAPVDNGDGTVGEGVLARVYFFSGSDPNPVRVAGDVQLTLFELTQPVTADRAADGKYNISASELSKHQRRDIIGNTYVFILPYRVQQSTRALVKAVFNGENGSQEASSTVTIEPINALSNHAPQPEQAAKPGVTRR